MAALAVDGDVDDVRRGAERTGVVHDRTRRHGGVVMEGQRVIRLREALEQAVLQHRFGAVHVLFGRLADQHQGAAPSLAVLRHQLGGAVPGRHVQVVAAGVHHRRRFAGGVLTGGLARERQAGLFLDRQRIHFGTQHHGRAGAVLQDRDDAGTGDAGRDFVAQRLDALGQLGGGLVLVESEFRIAVQILVQALDGRVVGVELFGERCRQRGGTGCATDEAAQEKRAAEDVG